MCARNLYCWDLGNKKSKISANKQRTIGNKEKEEQISRARKKDKKMTKELMLPSEHDML